MNSTQVTSAMLLALLLSGCSTLDSLPYFSTSETSAKANLSQGIAITQTEPPELESIRFFTDTPFSKQAAQGCIAEYVLPAIEEEPIEYAGRDVITTRGTTVNQDRILGISHGQHVIDFHLAVLGQHNGTHYGFSQLQLAREDKLKISSHERQPILAQSSNSKRAYRSLASLFNQLDHCVKESTNTK